MGYKEHWGKGEKENAETKTVETAVEETKVETNETQEGVAKSFHEIVAENKDYQSELDKTIAKALETAKSKWEKEAEVKRTEAEKLAKMDADEKLKYELEQEKERASKYERKLNAYELEKEATKLASEKGIPLSLTKVINFENATAESIVESLNNLETIYKQSVEEGVAGVMKERTPKTVVEDTTQTTTMPTMW